MSLSGAVLKYGDRAVQNSAGALIAAVDVASPAERAGLARGMIIETVDEQPLHDIIDWLWLSDGKAVELRLAGGGAVGGGAVNVGVGAVGGSTTDGGTASGGTATYPQTLTLNREYGEPWGIDFADPLFDGVKTCCNSCTFCFMTMLPRGMRPSLYLRDDDYRLSFLQGNFVTLTNLSDADVERIIAQRISPLHVSLHAVSPQVRRQLMGKNHARGIEVLDTLLAAGIEFHAQIVLLPNVNDRSELDTTLKWIEERVGIISVGIVPYGYTKYAKLQQGFSSAAARALIEQLAPYQERSRSTTGNTRFQLADEWYLLAGCELPESEYYDDFPQYEDGIGMLRSFIDEWQELTNVKMSSNRSEIYFVTGEAFAPTLAELLQPLPVRVIPIINHFFGGNVTVAGLLTAKDIITQLHALHIEKNATIVLPEVIFNADGLTLDDKLADDIALALDCQVYVIPCNSKGILSIFGQL